MNQSQQHLSTLKGPTPVPEWIVLLETNQIVMANWDPMHLCSWWQLRVVGVLM